MAESMHRLQVLFGQGLKRAREQQGLNQATLAALVGYRDHSNIVKIEGGKTLPSVGKAFALARVLRVPVDAFIAGGGTESFAGTGFEATVRAIRLVTPECQPSIVHVFHAVINDIERSFASNTSGKDT